MRLPRQADAALTWLCIAAQAAQIDLKSDAGNGSQPGPRVVASASPEVDEEADLDPDVSDEFVVGESAGAGEADDDDDYPEDFSDDFEDESDGDGGDDVLAPHRGPQRQTPPQGANNVSFKDEDAEMDDVLRAMQSENDKLSAGTPDGTSAPASGQHQQPSSANGVDAGPEFASRMNFRKAKATARNRSTSKSQRRWSDLAKLVELHSVPFTLFEQVRCHHIGAPDPQRLVVSHVVYCAVLYSRPRQSTNCTFATMAIPGVCSAEFNAVSRCAMQQSRLSRSNQRRGGPSTPQRN